MKTIELKLYKFSELSETAKEKAIEKWRNDSYNDQPWFIDEANDSFEKFTELFNIKWRSIDYQETYRNDYSFSNIDDNIRQLSGQRLATWLWNNHKTDLFKKKYLKHFDGHKQHQNIVNHTAKQTGNKYCFYYSPLQLEHSCVLTGVCYDEDILGPIYEFLDKPTNDDFEDLMNDCINSLCKSVSDEIDYNNTDEAITETIEANDYDFTENGGWLGKIPKIKINVLINRNYDNKTFN